MGEEPPGFSWHREGEVGAGEERAVCKALSLEDAGLSSPSSCSRQLLSFNSSGAGRSWVPPPPRANPQHKGSLAVPTDPAPGREARLAHP